MFTKLFEAGSEYVYLTFDTPSLTRDVVKLALPGFRHSVDWWGLPTRLEWALAPDRGALGYQTGSLAARMAFGRLRGPWVQELKSSGAVV